MAAATAATAAAAVDLVLKPAATAATAATASAATAAATAATAAAAAAAAMATAAAAVAAAIAAAGGGGIGYYGGDGGGGGSIIDSSAITNLAEVSGILSPDDPANGEIIITAVPTPLAIITTDAAFGFTNGVFGFDVTGPSGSNVVIQASTDLQTWIPLQTNLLGSGPLYFSDPQSTTNVQRFYRAQLSP